jgi:hypothetical protein
MGTLAVENCAVCRLHAASCPKPLGSASPAVAGRILAITMRSLKIFIVIVSILLFTAVGAGVYVWYEIQTYQKELRKPQQFDASTKVESSQISAPTVLE